MCLFFLKFGKTHLNWVRETFTYYMMNIVDVQYLGENGVIIDLRLLWPLRRK